MKKTLSAAFAFLSLSSLAAFGPACEGSHEAPALEANLAALAACHLDDGSIDHHDASLRACDPQDTKKTTICHVPPGNPANAHTLCIGNAAVKAHLHNHGDYLGACMNEAPCPTPPPPTSDSPTGGTTGTGTGGAPGTGGRGDAPTGGTVGTGGVPIVG